MRAIQANSRGILKKCMLELINNGVNLYLYVPLKGGTNAGEVYLKEVNWGCEVNSNYHRCYGRNIRNYGKKLKKNPDYGIPLLLFSTLPTEVTEISSIPARWLMLGELCETNNLVFACRRSDRVNKDAPQTCYLSPLRYRRMHYQNRQLWRECRVY